MFYFFKIKTVDCIEKTIHIFLTFFKEIKKSIFNKINIKIDKISH